MILGQSNTSSRHFISLGAGVQSSTMALMAAAGELTPMPEAAIFADTQWEPASVYEWLNWLKKQLPFPVLYVTAGSLPEAILQLHHSKRTPGNIYIKSLIPAYTLTSAGEKGMLPRQCTRDYKVLVIERKMRELTAKVPSVSWIGISTDEAQRMKDSRTSWITNRWPLIEANMTRTACLAWMEARGYPKPPRSACVACPYHSDREWVRLRDEEPAEFARAVAFEGEFQRITGLDNVSNGVPYLHSSRQPLGEVVFDEKTPDDRQLNLFGNECEGMCGV